MTTDTAQLSIPQLLEILETQIAEAEEETWETDAAIRYEIHEARTAYQAGDYTTIDEYVKNQS